MMVSNTSGQFTFKKLAPVTVSVITYWPAAVYVFKGFEEVETEVGNASPKSQFQLSALVPFFEETS